MGVLHLLLAQATLAIARVVEHQIRQADTPSSIFSPTPSSTESSQSSSANHNKSRDENADNGTSPLLFFVALGFGVVFTNLW